MPFLKFDPGLWLKGKVQLLTAEEKGIFIELMVRVWLEKGKIKNDEILARLIRVDKATLKQALLTFKELGIIIENNEYLSIKFIDQQITERLNYIENQRKIGAKGGRPQKGTKPKQKAESRKQREEYKENIYNKEILQSADRILKKHPRQTMPSESLMDICQAIQNYFDKPPVKTMQTAIAYIESRTELYASIVAQWPRDQMQFVTSSQNWYAKGCYYESEEEWKLRITQGNQGNNEHAASKPNNPKHVEPVKRDDSKRRIPDD
jgi:uncharacterized protein YdaU (DUF1376 family)